MALTSFEEQEINEIKSWWQDNYKTIIAIVVLAFAAAWGWRYWQEHQLAQAQSLSGQYDQIMYSNQDIAAKNAEIDSFVQAHGKTAYATLALLEKAKFAVQQSDFAQAATALQQAINESPDEILSSVAAVRLADVQIQQKEWDAALTALDQVKDPAWNARRLLLTGDIRLAQGDKAAAKASYEQAQKNATPLEQQWLQVRLNNLTL